MSARGTREPHPERDAQAVKMPESMSRPGRRCPANRSCRGRGALAGASSVEHVELREVVGILRREGAQRTTTITSSSVSPRAQAALGECRREAPPRRFGGGLAARLGEACAAGIASLAAAPGVPVAASCMSVRGPAPPRRTRGSRPNRECPPRIDHDEDRHDHHQVATITGRSSWLIESMSTFPSRPREDRLGDDGESDHRAQPSRDGDDRDEDVFRTARR